SGTESGLAGLWSLNGDNDQKITDMSVYGHHGYLGFSEAEEAGDPTWVSINDCGSGFNLRTSGFASGSSDFIINSPIVTNPYDSTYTNPVVVSPNPFENMLTFRVDSDRPEDLTISILNMQGLEVYKESNLRTNTTISIPNDWRAGYYIIRAIYAGRVEERKILKAY
ncbi:MAG: T9SS type A sorting domain-containing protein, partial [Bacteroidetes bacterium]|nr:T9SS type A sorting domain-containing protein [Bacteroidota bacterium]